LTTKVLLVSGARPNFVKVGPLWHEFRKHEGSFALKLVHTGQHYDFNMSGAFLRDLDLPKPDCFLGVGSGTHASQTAKVMVGFETVCKAERPDLVIVVGDVNSTMACAITAKKLLVSVAHVEAGLRSGDRGMPEEINRLVTDVLSDYLFTPSLDANQNLIREGVPENRIFFVGNVMIDSLVAAMPRIATRNTFQRLGLSQRGYGIVTLHRPSNVDDPSALEYILRKIAEVGSYPVVFPVHPRTRKNISRLGDETFLQSSSIRLLDPVGYCDFLNLVMNSKFVLTDSGGIQEETTYLGVPCITVRKQTERPITVTEGTNELCDAARIPAAIGRILSDGWKRGRIPDLWDGRASARIVRVLKSMPRGM
jgi:UDP-N-acetylglucosamine 2-epimerase (non-hydrolysing)